ncbi:Major facilitator superfamily MFS_1 [Methylorubrum extorquens]|uniref:Major facilitator superfamily MFS_1 n=1 Tax=Methylorubrum extorquens TaxID=408 RepID=A0A2N9APC5_METEX|nr:MULTISPECIES: MFS transporter [Methylorubrum]KQQ15293.1 ABC transporter permease [Methylobacterium sp. Leaf121]MDF9864636.1 MFS family permease [Methylorubrum pseudosasae]MDH6638220.1 MFS family permease [Methylobacterium sp. SuP10 SLI 274]ARO56769.1 MFS transporter [Methylorubrum zatmanii]MCP1559303.1 MFS family permease [Methylorubrum extorquens]
MTASPVTERRAYPARERDSHRTDLRERGGSRPVRRAGRPSTPGPAGPSRRATYGLDAFTFFIANLQTGFGPFLAVYFTQQKWTQSDIGLALTVGSLVSLLGQMPGGAFVDASRSKRFAAGFSAFWVGASAVMLAALPTYLVVMLAMAIHSAASCVLTPAIAAISIGLVGHARAGERLGRNASFSAVGNALGAAGMGAIGYYLSNNAVFYLAGVLVIPALVSLSFIPSGRAVEAGRPRPAAQEPEPREAGGISALLKNRALLCFAACMVLFFLANAAMLPLVGSVMTLRASETATALVAACIMVPQAVLALTAPFVGRLAERWGRKPLLVIGFAALPVRGLLFAFVSDPYWMVAIQVFDGISASVLGVMVPLIVSDVTRGTGRFNTALGAVGTGMGIGAALSTALAGFMADELGSRTAFLGLAIVGAAGLALVLLIMPETRRRNGDEAHDPS